VVFCNPSYYGYPNTDLHQRFSSPTQHRRAHYPTWKLIILSPPPPPPPSFSNPTYKQPHRNFNYHSLHRPVQHLPSTRRIIDINTDLRDTSFQSTRPPKMCIEKQTLYKACGCKVSEVFHRCAYCDEDFAECLGWTRFLEQPPQDGFCGRRNCKNPAPVKV
jgi:hypothetical protein